MVPDNRKANILLRVREGMTVYDARGEEIGKVETVFLGDISDDAMELGGGDAASPDINLGAHRTLVDVIAEALAADDLPREMAERLLNSGYIRVDGKGLLAADRYVLPEQISSVSDDSVRLRVPVDELVKR